jgi:hypothetical protein
MMHLLYCRAFLTPTKTEILLEATIERQQVERLKKKLVDSLGWGELESWTHRDFQNLSQLIFESTKEQVSVTTLKRLTGKVEYHGLPYQHTLDIVCQFVGYKSWLEFTREQIQPKNTKAHPDKSFKSVWVLWAFLLLILGIAVSIWWPFRNETHSLPTSKAVLKSNSPNTNHAPHTVNFYIEIPDEYKDKQNIISFGEKQGVMLLDNAKLKNLQVSHTYEKPGYYQAKIFSNKEVLATESILVETGGWQCTVYQHENPIPVSYKPILGSLTMVPAELSKASVDTSQQFHLTFQNYRNINLCGDSFTFAARLRSIPNHTNGYLPKVQIKLVFGNKPVFLSFDSSATSVTIYNQISDVILPEKDQKKFFRKSISQWSDIRFTTSNQTAKVFFNDKEIYTTTYNDHLGSLKGLEFRFRGIGEVQHWQLKDHEGIVVLHEKF